jgi:hypothetical protein
MANEMTKEYVNRRLRLSEDMNDEGKTGRRLHDVLAKNDDGTYRYSGAGNDMPPTDMSNTGNTNMAAGLNNAAAATRAGSDTTSPGAGAAQGGFQGAAAGFAMTGTPQGALIGGAVGALSGIMNARAKQKEKAAEVAREKAYKLSSIYSEQGIQGQNALATLMGSYNNILAQPRKK